MENESLRPLEILFENKILSRIENILIGSGFEMEGEHINASEFLRRVREGELIVGDDFFQPHKILENLSSPQRVNDERLKQKSIKGLNLYWIFEDEAADIFYEDTERGIEPSIELSRGDEQTGVIEKTFRYTLRDRNLEVDVDPEHYKKLRIKNELQDVFSAQFDEASPENGILVSLNSEVIGTS